MAKQDGEQKTAQGQDPQAKPTSDQGEGAEARDPASGEEQKERQDSGEQKRSEGGEQRRQGEGDQKGQEKRPSRVEWVVGIACTLLVLSAAGYLAYRALSGPELPPMVTIRVERVLPTAGGGYLVEIKAVNEGSGTAANLMVEGSLMRDTVVVEKSTATIQFVPAETEREAGLYFSKNPRQYRLEVRPTGYDRP